MAFAPAKSYGSSSEDSTGPHVVPNKPQKRYGDAMRVASLVGLLLFGCSYLYTNDMASVRSGAVTLEAQGVVAGLSADESAFMAGVEPEHIRENLHAYASVPHTCGTKQDYETALYMVKQFQSFGIPAEIKQYDTLLSYPVHRRVAIVSPAESVQELNLTEASVPGDSCTTDPTALPPFLAYAASGNVTASVVYANFGRQEDFEYLKSLNVSLAGKIALVRYGANMRGLKVMVAEMYDMAGVLIYSDPKEDGFTNGPVYPEGFYRPEDSFQRGSISYIPIAPGDPLTPGWASVPGAKQLKYEEVNSVPHIPALPLSYGQVKRLFAAISGDKAPAEWQGGLDMEYRLGSDDELVLNLDLVMDTHVGPIWDVIATIEGAQEPEKQVVLGNHRDAWVCGAVDPSSGTATMMEIARGLGNLLKQGWKPRRTIVLASWDGEEYALLGSTEYAEEYAEKLKAEAVAYLNVDLLVGPLVVATAAPSIANLIQGTASLLPANRFHGEEESGLSLLDQWKAQMAELRAATGGVAVAGDGTLAPDHLITFMGSGSDFTPFYQHLGVISVNLAFGLTYQSYGTYHSNMDSVMYMETVGDPLFASHSSMVRWWGLMALRLANDNVIPFDYSSYGLVMHDGLVELQKKMAAASLDVDFSKLFAAVDKFEANADVFQAAGLELNDAAAVSAWNEKAVQMERQLLSPAGLPHRVWYKHVIFGPGFFEGYAGAAFPGITDGLAFGDDATTIQEHVDEVTRVVTATAEYFVSEA